MKKTAICAVAAMLAALPASATEDVNDAIRGFFDTEVSQWASNQLLVDAINAQNSLTAGYDQAMIDQLDQAWRAEIGQPATPTITPVLANAASEFLRGQVTASGGRITEIFVMDARGLNVAASDVTSDYWQGDEDKHSATYGAGSGGFHISEIELDESTQRYQAQLSFTITDPSTGLPIGAMTVGVDADSLM